MLSRGGAIQVNVPGCFSQREERVIRCWVCLIEDNTKCSEVLQSRGVDAIAPCHISHSHSGGVVLGLEESRICSVCRAIVACSRSGTRAAGRRSQRGGGLAVERICAIQSVVDWLDDTGIIGDGPLCRGRNGDGGSRCRGGQPGDRRRIPSDLNQLNAGFLHDRNSKIRQLRCRAVDASRPDPRARSKGHGDPCRLIGVSRKAIVSPLRKWNRCGIEADDRNAFRGDLRPCGRVFVYVNHRVVHCGARVRAGDLECGKGAPSVQCEADGGVRGIRKAEPPIRIYQYDGHIASRRTEKPHLAFHVELMDRMGTVQDHQIVIGSGRVIDLDIE